MLYFRAALFSLLILRPSTHWLKVSGWPRCFHSKFRRESSQVFGILPTVAALSGKIRHDRIASSCGGWHVCRDRLAEFCGEPRVGLQILPMALPARRIPTILCAALFKKKKPARLAQGLFHHPTSHWCIACASLLPGCSPRTGSLHPSVGVSIALRICSAGCHWWALTVFPLWRSAGKKPTHRTLQSGC